ncbi:molybdopterin-dependent oxidoreductase [Arenibaculum sp.]|jgi:hypothetical protein|uniref:molybdopterin-dependent oxidoreductase n=1 Tax=Arenibaculum sp. TaxID=2865862 RepID=UPI002E13B5CE|nr:molybdopterin-dependent oxidoreductase [Arenibaculum sp.]
MGFSVVTWARTFNGVALGLLLWTAEAAALEKPAGDIVLTVGGQVSETNAPSAAVFDMAMLSALPQTKFEATTRWTDTAVFEGVLLRDLLEAVGAEGTQIVATALNEFSATIPMDDVVELPVLLATRVNGEPMKVRDFGPLWIVYDVDGRPDLQNLQTERKMVWQLKELVVR